MENQFEIPLNNEAHPNNAGKWLWERIGVTEDAKFKPAAVILIMLAVLLPVLMHLFGIIPGILTIIAIAAPFVLYAIIAYPKVGIIALMVMSYLLMWFIKMDVGFPIGTVMDGLQFLLLIGLLLKVKFSPPGNIYKNPITYLIVAWIIYNVLEVVNPAAESKLAWVYTIRTVATVMLMYFVFVYHVRTERFLRLILKLWLALSLFAALYALYQEYIGFLPFEQSGINTPEMRALLFIDGHWRKFSIFADPVTFSYNMVASSLLCIGLMTGNITKRSRFILAGMAMLFTFVMLFSGTRGAYVLLPLAFALLAVLKMNRKVLLTSLGGILIIIFLVFVPTTNYTLYRFQTAFRPSNDASFNVRKANQQRIQPYILSHPFGGGLGATGGWGQRFAPNSYLANFPPDSGYVRVAVELGWVGLLLFCSLIFTVLRKGIEQYFSIRDPALKSYSLAMVLIIFALAFGNYPQEAFVQFPTNIYLYIAIALINILPRLDQQKQPIIHAN